MRWWVAGLGLGCAGCYAPHPVLGAPCDPLVPACPSGQRCIAGFCGGAPGDGAVTDDDQDGDGVPDAADNCPTIANIDQGNEDGDRFGDVCDPCPSVADDQPADGDGDGIADACDPYPTTPGDRIVLFEGFHHGLPADWTTQGTVVASADALDLVAPTIGFAYAAPALAAPVRGTVTAGFTILAAGSLNAEVGPAMPFDGGSSSGLQCQLLVPVNDPTVHALVLHDFVSTNDLARAPLAWTIGAPQMVTLVRDGTRFTCQSGAVSVTATSGSSVGNPGIAVRGHDASWRLAWLMVVASP